MGFARPPDLHGSFIHRPGMYAFISSCAVLGTFLQPGRLGCGPARLHPEPPLCSLPSVTKLSHEAADLPASRHSAPFKAIVPPSTPSSCRHMGSFQEGKRAGDLHGEAGLRLQPPPPAPTPGLRPSFRLQPCLLCVPASWLFEHQQQPC